MTLRLAFRTLFKTPFVTSVAILSLALGIGANTAIYSVIDQILLRPMDVPEAERLVNLGAPPPKPGNTSCNQAGECDVVFSYAMFRDLERQQTVFTGVAAHFIFAVNLAMRGQTTSTDGLFVSGSYFPVLGLKPALGRLLSPADDQPPGEPHVVVLSHAYWTQRLGRDPNVLNLPLIVNGQPMTVVGVAPEGFTGTTLGARPQVFVPITLRDVMMPGARISTFENRRSYWVYVFARLKPGVTIEQARTAINVPYHAILNDVEAPLQQGMSDQTMAKFRARQVTLVEGAHGQSNIDEARAPLALLFGVTVFVLLIACANIANLLLARSAARASEMAIRLSIGASRRHLITQLLTESCLLATMGGLAGLLVARWTLDLMMALLPADVVEMLQFHLDWSVLPVTAGVTLTTGILFGLFPALHSTRPDLITSIKGSAGQPSGAKAASRFRTSLATAQIALSMALLVAAGLFSKSLINVGRANLGLNPDHVVMFRVAPGLSGFKPERSRQFFEQLEDALAAMPGVTKVSTSTVPLLSGSNNNNSLIIEGYEAGPDTDTSSRVNRVAPGYFNLLEIPTVAGRDFTRADGFTTPKVAIVNEAWLKKYNLGMDFIGRHVGQRDGQNKYDTEVVGVVKNAKYSEVKQEMLPTFYLPYRQADIGIMTYYVKTSVDPETVMTNIRKTVASIDQAMPVDDVRTLPQQVHDSVFLDRFIGTLSTAFAVLATLLAAIGLYGVLAYTVSQRTKELGLRMALGAAPGRVRGMVLKQVGKMIAVGGAIGLTAAIWLGTLAASLLFQMNGSDPVVLTSAAVVLTLVALAAGFVPANRASQIDPMRALRYE